MKTVVRLVGTSFLLLALFSCFIGPLTVFAASTQVQLVSNGGDWTNQGDAFINSSQYAFGQTYGINTGTYSLMVSQTIIYGGNRYDFDHWNCSGSVSIANQNSTSTSITISGTGQVYAYFVRQDFTLDVTPASQSAQVPNTAQYSFIVTRKVFLGSPDNNSLEVDLSVSGMTWSASGPNYRFAPNQIIFSGSSQTSISGIMYINTTNATPNQYTLTVSGTINSTSTSHQKQVSLTVNPATQYYPDLIISNISVNPTNPNVGQSISVTYTEKNVGQGDAPSHTNTLYIDGLISTDNISSLAAGSSITRTFPQTWTVTSLPHTILVQADYYNVVYEGPDGETNNSLTLILGSKIGTQLTVTVNPSSVPPSIGTMITVSGTLTRTDTGAGIANAYISLTVLGGSYYAYTNSAGNYIFSLTTPNNMVEGSSTIYAYYEGMIPSTIVLHRQRLE